MSTSTPRTTTTTPSTATGRVPLDVRRPPARIPSSRLLRVELAKMLDTRSGLWLMVGIAATALVATGGVIALAPDGAATFETFASAIGVPLGVLLPVVAILLVTSEWSQRSGLTTFTLVPDRSRVIAAKAVVSVAVGTLASLLALAIAALGNLIGGAIGGIGAADPVWDISAGQVATLVLANVVNLMIGFTFAVLLRSSAAALVGYFVFTFALPQISLLLGVYQDWWAAIARWADVAQAKDPLYAGGLTGQQWAHLGTAGLIWLVVPLAVGLVLVLRSEVK